MRAYRPKVPLEDSGKRSKVRIAVSGISQFERLVNQIFLLLLLIFLGPLHRNYSDFLLLEAPL